MVETDLKFLFVHIFGGFRKKWKNRIGTLPTGNHGSTVLLARLNVKCPIKMRSLAMIPYCFRNERNYIGFVHRTEKQIANWVGVQKACNRKEAEKLSNTDPSRLLLQRRSVLISCVYLRGVWAGEHFMHRARAHSVNPDYISNIAAKYLFILHPGNDLFSMFGLQLDATSSF